jgi:hypothetical protein
MHMDALVVAMCMCTLGLAFLLKVHSNSCHAQRYHSLSQRARVCASCLWHTPHAGTLSLIPRCHHFVRYIDALGAAARVGVDVFCRETLVGEWLETIGLWQQGEGLEP